MFEYDLNDISETPPPCHLERGFYRRTGKRLVDLLGSALLLLLLSPLLILISVLLKLASPGPVFYHQVRVGKHGRHFRIAKFRSMIPDADHNGPALTSAGDRRVTPIGKWLRRFKLDELPQLWNVLVGDMSIVGPRPEIPSYVAMYDRQQRTVLAVRPGITDNASLAFRWEEELLSRSRNPEEFYREMVLPRKLALNLDYIANISFARDLSLVLRTARALFERRFQHQTQTSL